MKIRNRAGIARARRIRNEWILATLTVMMVSGGLSLFFWKFLQAI